MNTIVTMIRLSLLQFWQLELSRKQLWKLWLSWIQLWQWWNYLEYNCDNDEIVSNTIVIIIDYYLEYMQLWQIWNNFEYNGDNFNYCEEWNIIFHKIVTIATLLLLQHSQGRLPNWKIYLSTDNQVSQLSNLQTFTA